MPLTRAHPQTHLSFQRREGPGLRQVEGFARDHPLRKSWSLAIGPCRCDRAAIPSGKVGLVFKRNATWLLGDH